MSSKCSLFDKSASLLVYITPQWAVIHWSIRTACELNSDETVVSSFRSFLRGFCRAWTTETDSVKMSIFLCALGRLYFFSVAAAPLRSLLCIFQLDFGHFSKSLTKSCCYPSVSTRKEFAWKKVSPNICSALFVRLTRSCRGVGGGRGRMKKRLPHKTMIVSKSNKKKKKKKKKKSVCKTIPRFSSSVCKQPKVRTITL